MAKEEIKANDARLRTQVKEAWKDFEKRNPKVAKELKAVGRATNEFLTSSSIYDTVLGGVTRKKAKQKEKEKRDKEII